MNHLLTFVIVSTDPERALKIRLIIDKSFPGASIVDTYGEHDTLQLLSSDDYKNAMSVAIDCQSAEINGDRLKRRIRALGRDMAVTLVRELPRFSRRGAWHVSLNHQIGRSEARFKKIFARIPQSFATAVAAGK